MILRVIAASDSIEIDEPSDFRAFSVRLEGPFPSAAAEAALLDRIAARRDPDHAWVREDVLRAWAGLAGEAWWDDGLTRMLASVERFGWVDPATRSVRAHIERR